MFFHIFIRFSFGLSKDAFADLIINSSLKTPLFLASHSLLSAIKTLLFKCFTQSVEKLEDERCLLGIVDLMYLFSTQMMYWCSRGRGESHVCSARCGTPGAAQEWKVALLRCRSGLVTVPG